MYAQIRMIWGRLQGQRSQYLAAIGALLLASGFLYLIPLIPMLIIDGVLLESTDTSPILGDLVELSGGAKYLRSHLWIAGVWIIGFSCIAGAFTYLQARLAAEASETTARRLRDDLFEHLQHLPVEYHDRTETGDLVQRCTTDVETLRLFLSSQVIQISRAVFRFLVPLPMMIWLSPRMTLISVVAVVPVVSFCFFFFRHVREQFQRVDDSDGHMTSVLQENLSGIRVVRGFARHDFEKSKFAERIRERRDLEFQLYQMLARFWSISDVMCMGQNGLVLVCGGYWVATDALLPGTLLYFILAVNLFIWPVRMLGRILNEMGKATVAIGRIGEILSVPTEKEIAKTTSLQTPITGAIKFDNVSFSYGDTPILEKVNFELEAGRTLALLGPSGAGKSTIVQLLLRLLDPDRGTIRLDGIDIKTLSRKTVRQQIAVVMQEPFLFSKSLAANLKLGRDTAKLEEIEEATRLACIHHGIESFDRGYDTEVGERGVTLSGGQRQRVALSRALLEESPVLLLDDALSAVDTDTEAQILHALNSRRKKHTTIVIAHRLSTLRHADEILVLEEGRVVQRGVHKTLLQQEGLYRRIWQIQNDLEDELKSKSMISKNQTTDIPPQKEARDDRV